MASHPKLDGDGETRERPLPGMPTVGVLNHRLVNLWIARLGSDGELGGHKYVYWFEQNVPNPVHGGLCYWLYIWFVVGVTDDREMDGYLKSLFCVKRALKTALLARR
jgi:hypothetical protein